MKKLLAVLPILLFAALPSFAQTKYVGGDISLLTKYEEHGAKYFESDGTAISDMLTFYKQNGWNAMRVRLFVDPSKASTTHKGEGVCQDLDFVIKLGKRIKDAGFAFMLDFHYSDTWTDPGKHSTPSAWSSLSVADMTTRVYDYTKDCLQQLINAGATPDFIQPGNEITYGMLWPTGHIYPAGGGQDGGSWDNFAAYLKSGIRACREVCPQAKVVIQTELSKSVNVTNFYNTLKSYTSDYDVIGISYYPHYHGTLTTLENLIKTLETTYKDKKIQIVETGYFHKWYPDNATYKISSFPNWPATDAGQKQFTQDLIAMLNKHNSVDGLYWWFPEANEYGLNWNTQRVTDNWYNASLFDNETGKAMGATYILKDFLGNDTGVEDIQKMRNAGSDKVFDLQGRRLKSTSAAGIYVKGNKKIVRE